MSEKQSNKNNILEYVSRPPLEYSFRGNNVIKMNRSTMIDIVQKWYNEAMRTPPTVINVVYESNDGGWFNITIQEQETKNV